METISTPENAWLFDVDGVLTDPIQKEITHPEILDEIIRRLEKGEPVGLNTGRPVEFIAEQVLQQLEERIEDKSLLNNVFAIGEMGAVWIVYKDGEKQTGIDKSVTVPEALKDEIREVGHREFGEFVFFDEAKKTMITLEMLKGMNLDLFHKKRPEIVDALRRIVDPSKYPDLKVEPTNIAVDVLNSHVGKGLGARRFVEMLKDRGIKPKRFFTFGDTMSDKEMHEELVREGNESSFIYVGKGDVEGSHKPQAQFDEGTLEYLKSS